MQFRAFSLQLLGEDRLRGHEIDQDTGVENQSNEHHRASTACDPFEWVLLRLPHRNYKELQKI